MPSVVTHDLRVHNARSFVDSVNHDPEPGESEGMPRSYVFVGKPTEWAAGDNKPPVPTNSVQEYYQTYDEMLSLKRIRDLNCFLMIYRYPWVSGTIYDIYRHDYSQKNLAFSGADNLYDAVFYTINQYNDIYVCLNNFFNQPSIDEPVSDGYEPFFTSDGYQWMKLYSVKQQILFDYSTTNFIPITTDGVNLDNYERTFGEIITVVVDNPGSGFRLVTGTNSVEQVTNYFCKIVGDGEAAVANVRLSGEGLNASVVDVRIARSGSNYTFAELDFRAYRVFRSLADLDANKNAIDPGGENFASTVIIGPQGGWGRDLPRLLGATRVGVFSNFGSQTYDFFSDATFRQIGILHDLEWNQDVVGISPETLSACYAMTVNEVSGQGTFIMGETINQQVQDINGNTRLAKGTIVGYDEDEKILRYIVIPNISQANDGQIYPFELAGLIIGVDSGKTVEVRDFTGSESNLTFVNGFADSEVIHDTGYMTYLGNIQPVQREETQTERLSLIIQY